MGTYNQQSFIGGLNRLLDPTKLQPNEYPYLKNGRNRFDLIEPVNSPLELTDVPEGKIQGLYGAGNYLVIFVDGVGYYRDYSKLNPTFTKLSGNYLDASVDNIYLELVPAATVLGFRKLASTTNIIGGGINYTSQGLGTPQCLVAQDGINQPVLIFPDGSTLKSQNYTQWSIDRREYVPIGKQMLFLNGVLYIVSSDGLQLYRSVTGRPLDFMVIIDQNGNKLPTEAEGGVSNISHRVDYDTITCIRALNSQDGSFLVSTSRASYMVQPVLTSTVYGEPIFKNTYLFSTGALNENCVVDLLGDTALIDYTGIRSFNAVFQTKYEGRNAPFSAKIQSLFNGVIQEQPCAFEFDNYAFFAVKSIYGNVVLVFDTINQKYVGFDSYENVGVIQQFASIKTALSRKLLFYTDDNKIYEAFGSTSVELCEFFAGEYCTNNPSVEQQPKWLKTVFIDALENGTVYATPYIDRLPGIQYSALVKGSTVNESIPISEPFGHATDDTAKIKTFNLGRERQGWKAGILIKWQFKAKLSHVLLETSDIKGINTMEESAIEQTAYSKGVPRITSFNPATGTETTTVHVFGNGFNNLVAVRVGDTYSNGFTIVSDSEISFGIPVGSTTNKIYLVFDNYEVETLTNFTML